jgi:hypothetical protein
VEVFKRKYLSLFYSFYTFEWGGFSVVDGKAQEGTIFEEF